MKRTLYSEGRIQHLAQSIMLEERGSPGILRFIIVFGCVVVTVFLVWANAAVLDEVAVAHGEVVSTINVTRIQHLKGGIISKIYVKDGEHVTQGQVLILLNPLEFRSQLDQAQAQLETFAAQKIRFEALMNESEPEYVLANFQNLEIVEDQLRVFTQERDALLAEGTILENQKRQNKAELEEATRKAVTLRSQLNLLEEEMSLRKESVDRGVGSKIQYLSLQRSHTELRGELDLVPIQKKQIGEKILELENRLRSLSINAKRTYAEELARIDERVIELRNTVKRYVQDVQYFEIRSPIDGYVHGMKTNSVGEIVGAGETIMEIVPKDQKLVASVQISSRDIGHVAADQPVTLKVATYDFRRYGVLAGTLSDISPTSLFTETGEPYFKGIVALAANYIGTESDRYPLIPGMTLQAEIKTGSKTVLEYLFQPIQTSATTALRER